MVKTTNIGVFVHIVSAGAILKDFGMPKHLKCLIQTIEL